MTLGAIRAGDRRALARFLTKVENDRPAVTAELAQLYTDSDAAEPAVIGLTGAPGVGKSALVAALATTLRERDLTVAIVTVDPSSPFSGGAILGDRIRMRALAGDRGVFIRSMASRGHLGGLAWATQDVVRVLGAAGYNLVIVETVGAGQSEVEIARLAHTTIVVVAPGAGDGVQALKAGILEIADILVVNKSDLPGAEAVARSLQSMLELSRPADADSNGAPPWLPSLLCTSALKQTGLEELADCIAKHQSILSNHGLMASRRESHSRVEFEALLKESLYRRLIDTITATELAGIIERITNREIDPQQAVDKVLEEFSLCRPD